MKLPKLLSTLFLLPALAGAQTVQSVKYADLAKRLAQPSDTTYVVNFWATWCAPCIKELPSFEQLNADYANKKVKVLLVSMDTPTLLDKKVVPFVQKRGLKSEVLLMNEPDPNAWLTKLDKKWSGAIPYTLIVNNKKNQRTTFEKELTQAELTAAVQKAL
ncbi:TlpA family protein disulfide reductase [Hymenobacter aerilatus]|uniref:TlpA family protein disulfide reductase n=1 Tax=Hymenobacter aerilatus TaxID=2932251 RepID=A0A8T9SXF5_9BACT|nr:TlpA disulfide reductase family protein [Hymenobacter aerilatus]UOR06768.1 TlpA family protein disulfide reductase [Hymenobacter aerilatus]